VQLCNRCRSFHVAPLIGNANAIQGKREGLAQQGDTAAMEAERFGLTTATRCFEWQTWKSDRAEPDEVESMPRNNPAGKPN
jgi:hypothetical protein